jgi:hypothetical protein
MFKYKLLLIIFCLLFFAVRPVEAIVDPLAVPNNRFGIHVLEPEDLLPAANLVNTQGGDWGYVTVVLRLNDLNQAKWQTMFDEMRRRHLIPIVRLATVPENSHWVKPKPEDTDQIVEFLNSLNWVIQNRYVVLFNEPNHAQEWGNELNPREYVTIVQEFHAKLKAASADFFLLPAGLDTAAPNSQVTLAAAEYWRQMYLADPEIFQLFDGWNSHSYPNPGFSGPLTGTGFGSLRSYLAEINYLSRFGLPLNLPLFITETGWSNTTGDLTGSFIMAFTQVWTESRLVTVTPFILNYPDAPFSQFSWQIPHSREFYPHYHQVASLPKISGRPIQIHQSQLIKAEIPRSLVDSSHYQFKLQFKNTGQSIWNPADFSLALSGNFPPDLIKISSLSATEPNQTAEFTLDLITPAVHNRYRLGCQLKFKEEIFGEKFESEVIVVPPPTLIARVKLLFKKSVSAADFKLLVYDTDNQLQTKLPLAVVSGQSRPIPLYNLIPNQIYRFVILKPLYLPRQLIAQLNPDQTTVKFKTMLPSFADLINLIF